MFAKVITKRLFFGLMVYNMHIHNSS